MLWILSLALSGAVAGGPVTESKSPVKVLAPSPAVIAANLLAAETRHGNETASRDVRFAVE